jgi:glycerol-3-phosphate dehydrogenase (NAD(P)+)
VGLEVCAALKNAYTLGVGLAAGLLEKAGGVDAAGAHMHNLAAAVFAQGCTEIDRMLQLMGGTRAFAYGLPGAGDFFVTVQGGRSMRLGRLLGLGHAYAEAQDIMAEETLEAAQIVLVLGEALPKLTERGVVDAADFPLLRALADVVSRGRPGHLPLDAFFQGLGF